MSISEKYEQMKWIIARSELVNNRKRGSFSYQMPKSSSTFDMHQRVSGLHLGLRSIVLPETADWLSQIKIDMYNVNQSQDVIDATSLPEIGIHWNEYECEPMSATVHTALQFMHEHRGRRTVVFKNEFWYHQRLAQKKIASSEELRKEDLLILSVPFYANFKNLDGINNVLSKCTDLGIPVLLDIIWLPLTKEQIKLSNTECVQVVTQSLSKTLPIAGMKGGFAFWKKPIVKEHLIYPLGNKLMFHLAQRYIEDFGYHYVRDYCVPFQKKWCTILGLEQHDLCYVGNIPKGHWLEAENLHAHEFDIEDKLFSLIPYIENDEILSRFIEDN